MPVFPDVGSSRTVSFPILPSRSAASIIETPIRSFTLPAGLRLSSLAATVARAPSITRLSRTSGVLPMVFVMSSAMRMWEPLTGGSCRYVIWTGRVRSYADVVAPASTARDARRASPLQAALRRSVRIGTTPARGFSRPRRGIRLPEFRRATRGVRGWQRAGPASLREPSEPEEHMQKTLVGALMLALAIAPASALARDRDGD